MKNCFLTGASENGVIYIPDEKNILIIAADGGYVKLRENGIEPDIILGDFDSSKLPEGNNISVYPKEKDKTDMALAVEKGIEAGCDNFFVFGGTGGRPDHTYANFQLLYFLAEKGKRGYLFYDDTVATIINNSKICFDSCEKGYVSVFSYGEKAEYVSIKGLKYELENAPLSNAVPLGVSNEFINKPSEISVGNGSLVVIWQADVINTIDKLIK